MHKEYSPHTWLEIDKSALCDNFEVLSTSASNNGKAFMLMVKANGYGHGAIEIAKIASAQGSKVGCC